MIKLKLKSKSVNCALAICTLLIFSGCASAAVTENINIDDWWQVIISNDYVNRSCTHPDNVFIANTSTVANDTAVMAWNSSNMTLSGREPDDDNLFIGQLYPATHTRYRVQVNITKDNITDGTNNPNLYLVQGALFKIGIYKYPTYYRMYMNTYDANGNLANPSVKLGDPGYADVTFEYYPNETVRMWNTSNPSTYLEARYHNDKHTPYVASTGNFIRAYPGGLGNGSSFKILKFEQSIPKKLITFEPSNNKLAYGFDGPRRNYTDGKDWLVAQNATATLWLDPGYITDENREELQDLVRNKGWELGAHFSEKLTTLSAEDAINLMNTEYTYLETTYDKPVVTWCSLGNGGNESQVNYMYEHFGSIHRNSQVACSGSGAGIDYMYGASTVSTTSNIKFWDAASAHGTIHPVYEHSVIDPLQEANSISYTDFNRIMTNYTNAGIKIVPMGQWWYEVTNQNQTISNIHFDKDNSYFNTDTRGYISNYTIYDPNNASIWYAEDASVSTTLSGTNVTKLTVVTSGEKTIQKLSDIITSTSGEVTFTPIAWNNTSKIWRESSSTQNTTIQHIIGGFQANTSVQIIRDGINYTTVTSNKNGYIDWTYAGEYGEHEFEIYAIPLSIQPVLPVANFTSNTTEGYSPLTVQFNDNSENAASVAWDFNGDGNADSEDRNPVHEFTIPGNYTVNLTASNENGTDSTSVTINVTEKPESVLPVANFTSNTTEGYAPLTVQFNDSSENADSVTWDFDGNGNLVYEFATPGTHIVNLTARNENGTDSTSVTINVTEKPESVLPVANFTSNTTEGYAPLTVQFSDLSENATGVSWDFNGDGVSDSQDRNPVYEFTIPGNYTVNLTASNVDGSSDKKSMVITVNRVLNPLIADFIANTTKGYAPLSVQFTDTSAGLPTSWEWNFGDGSPNSTEQNPNHIYSMAGTYTVILNASNAAGHSINTQTSCITALNNNEIGSLTLVNTDFSQLSSIPRGMYIEATADSAPSNITLTYNSALKCADITYTKNASGSLFFTNLYPTTDSNTTYTLGTEGVSVSSYVNVMASNSRIAVFKKANGDYKLTSYWTGDDADTHPSYITVPAASIKNNKVTFSVVCYESNRTNMLKYNDTIYTKTPFITMKTRNQNYVFVNQPMVYFSSYIASSDTGPCVLHLYSIKQEIPRKTITSYGNRSISALTITYPDPENNGNGINLMKSNGQKSTIYVDTENLDPAKVAYEKALLDEGWEMGIHYTVDFGTVSDETAIATMDSEYSTIVNTFGRQPKTWCAKGNSGNISQAMYAYQRYGMIWRSCESGALWLHVENLGNSYWRWWNTSIPQGVIFPAYTIATDKEPVTGSSINASYFTMFSNGFAANNIRLCGFNEYYFTQSAQNTTQVNITDSNNSYMRFTVTTSGYPCTLNVMTDMSNVEISHDGVSVPYTSVDDGVVFTATNNTTYELRSVSSSPEQPVAILPVANFSTNITEGYVPLTVQFNDSSENATGVSWDFNGDGNADSEDRNPVYEFTTPGIYTVNLTASNADGTDLTSAVINVTEKPEAVLPVANFSANVSEGYAPLSVQFNDSSENATGVSWDFNGDGNADSEDRNPVHEFTTPRIYTVNLTASNADGTDSTSAVINVTEKPEAVLPVANFSANVSGGYAPLTVQFNDSSENATGVSWEFGDGSTSTDANPTHTYATANTYVINLTVSNADGTDTASKTITVTETTGSPKASFTAAPTFGRAPLKVKFKDTSVNAASIKWNFGDGTTSTDANPSHTYRTGGFYTIKLTATNGGGSNTASKTIFISR